MLSPHEIAEATDNKEGPANIKAINKLFRAQDESRLFPVNGRFNATERAIRRARRFAQQAGPVYGIEYALQIDAILTEIINDPKLL